MSIEDRLFALAQQYSGQHGAAGLADQTKMVPQLSSQAPDLHAEIKALAAAVAGNAAGRIAGAGNADLETQAIAGEIAAAQKLSMASVTPALAVARRLGAMPNPTAAPVAGGGNDGWAGDSVIAGSGPTPPYSPPVAPPAAPYNPGFTPTPPGPPAGAAQPPIWQNKWAVGGAAAVLALLAYQNFGKSSTPDPINTGSSGGSGGSSGMGPGGSSSGMGPGGSSSGMGPGGSSSGMGPGGSSSGMGPGGSSSGMGPGGSSGGGGQGGLPALAPPGGQLPTVMVQPRGQGFVVGFMLNGISTMVAAPEGGWDRGPGMVMLARDPRAQQPDSLGSGMFERINSNQGPSRLMKVQWQQDNLKVGPMCIAFVGSAGGQDVTPQGARVCVLDGGCSQAIACGQLPSGGGGQGGNGGMQPGQ